VYQVLVTAFFQKASLETIFGVPFVYSPISIQRIPDSLANFFACLSVCLFICLSVCLTKSTPFRQMRKGIKPPSEWLKLLCPEWAAENPEVVDASDHKFLEYKSYLKGELSPQLLCRLSTPPLKEDDGAPPGVDFWGILGVQDEFDKSYIIAQVERFSALYNIRGSFDEDNFFEPMDPATVAAAAAAGMAVSPGGDLVPWAGMDTSAATAAAAAAAAVAVETHPSKFHKKDMHQVSRAHRMAKDVEKALEVERKHSTKKEQRRISQERKDQKSRERETIAMTKAAERAAREATREERRQRKLEIRMAREKFQEEQKQAALKRAAELVRSNRVPLEITRGSAAAKAAANAAVAASGVQMISSDDVPKDKHRSCITVSTASDLHQIVTHSKNLWTKYNAIAKEHNQKVNWTTVAKELGIHVKVREKYARMHSRAEQRGFDWEKDGNLKIKDYPHIFLEPTVAEQNARMPPPPPDIHTTVLIGGEGADQSTEDAVAAAAAVVDASVDAVSDEQVAAAAAVAATTMVADPTAGLSPVDEAEV
jgi:hypothetical protein